MEESIVMGSSVARGLLYNYSNKTTDGRCCDVVVVVLLIIFRRLLVEKNKVTENGNDAATMSYVTLLWILSKRRKTVWQAVLYSRIAVKLHDIIFRDVRPSIVKSW
jgi:hypothetical protein